MQRVNDIQETSENVYESTQLAQFYTEALKTLKHLHPSAGPKLLGKLGYKCLNEGKV